MTGQPWRGQQRRTRMVVYRRLGNSYTDPMPPVAMLNQMCDRLVSSLGSAGVQCVRQDGRQVHQWLLRHFNPAPDWVDRETLYREGAYWPAAEKPGHPAGAEGFCGNAVVYPAPVGCGKRRVVV